MGCRRSAPYLADGRLAAFERPPVQTGHSFSQSEPPSSQAAIYAVDTTLDVPLVGLLVLNAETDRCDFPDIAVAPTRKHERGVAQRCAI